MVSLREDKNGEGVGGETRGCRDRAGESGTGLKRGGKAAQAGTREGPFRGHSRAPGSPVT